MNFISARDREKDNELKISNYFAQAIKASGLFNVPCGYNPDYDFSVIRNDKTIYFEVKLDYKCKRTGNIYVETGSANRNCDAGLMTTKADWVIYGIPHLNLLYVCRPYELLSYAEENGRFIPCAGDGSYGYAVPLAITGSLGRLYPFQFN